MRNPESTRSKLLLLPLIPALAFGIVDVATRISMLTPIAAPVVVIEHSVPVKRIVEPPPAPLPAPECRGCVTAT